MDYCKKSYEVRDPNWNELIMERKGKERKGKGRSWFEFELMGFRCDECPNKWQNEHIKKGGKK